MRMKHALTAVVAAAGLIMLAGSARAQEGEDVIPGVLQFDGAWVSLWTEQQLEQIAPDETNTMPYVRPDTPLFSEEFLTWDGWPIRNVRTGEVTVFPGGWVVYIALSAPRGSGAGGGGNLAQWRYWYTNGGEWIPGGAVFGESTPFGGRQWAGSTRFDPETGRVTFYYTAVGDFPAGADPVLPDEFPQGDPSANRPPVTQQIASVSAEVFANQDGVTFDNFSEHQVILTADGRIYQTHGDSVTDAVIYGFRDPWHFIHPQTGEEYILFTANAAYKPGPHNGVVGLARRNEEGEWRLLPPILQAAGTSSQLERPHLVLRPDAWYLFFTTHNWTFSPQDAGPEGLYGFVNDRANLRGNWNPLNEGGLVAGNPAIEPAMAYSWLVLPDGNVMSYIKTVPESDFLAVPSPLFQIAIEGDETRIVDTLTPIGPGVGGTDETREFEDGDDTGGDGGDDEPPRTPSSVGESASGQSGEKILERAFGRIE